MRTGFLPVRSYDSPAVESLDRFLERIALDEPHGVVRTAVGISAQAVDGDDARVLQARR